MQYATVVTALLLLSIKCYALEPSPSLDASDVVRHQLDSLRLNTTDDAGISATFDFASPANKQVTGPLTRFSRLFDNPRYSPMLNHQLAEISLIHSDDVSASFDVELIDNNGAIHHYRFELSRQQSGACIGCWMTDAVMWKPKPGRSA